MNLAHGPRFVRLLGGSYRTVEALAGVDAPRTWPDETVALLGAGRATPDAGQRTAAPEFIRRLPVLGRRSLSR